MEKRFTTKMEPVTRALLLANVIVFAIQLLLFTKKMAHWYNPLIFDCAHTAPYQFISYQFLHNGISHLYNNMIVLYFFGPPVERALGKIRFLISYITFGVAAVLAHTLVAAPADTLVGASGSIFGVVALFTLVERSYLYIGGRKLLPMAAISFILVATEIPHAFDRDSIGHMAHVGGAAAGTAAYFVFRKRARIYRECED